LTGSRFLGRVGCRFGQLISGHAPEVPRPGSRWGGASNDCPLMSVMRCRWSLLLAGGCCHRCCQPRPKGVC